MTAYEMRISDWSSAVCSSDLAVLDDGRGRWPHRNRALSVARPVRHAQIFGRREGHTSQHDAFPVGNHFAAWCRRPDIPASKGTACHWLAVAAAWRYDSRLRMAEHSAYRRIA